MYINWKSIWKFVLIGSITLIFEVAVIAISEQSNVWFIVFSSIIMLFVSLGTVQLSFIGLEKIKRILFVKKTSPKISHRFKLSKDNELSLYIHNPKWAKDINVLYQFKKFADYQGKEYIKKYPSDLKLLNHLNEGTEHTLALGRLTHNDTREVKIGIYKDGKLALFFGNALLTGFRDGTFEYVVSCSGEYRNEKFTNPDFSVWLTIKDGVLIKMAKEL